MHWGEGGGHTPAEPAPHRADQGRQDPEPAWVLMGLGSLDSSNPQDTLKIWGKDPVHPLDTAYTKMAEKVLEEVNLTVVFNPRQTVSPSMAREPVRQRARESWMEETLTVASRTGKWSHGEVPMAAAALEVPT